MMIKKPYKTYKFLIYLPSLFITFGVSPSALIITPEYMLTAAVDFVNGLFKIGVGLVTNL